MRRGGVLMWLGHGWGAIQLTAPSNHTNRIEFRAQTPIFEIKKPNHSGSRSKVRTMRARFALDVER